MKKGGHSIMSILNLVKATIIGDGHVTPTGRIKFKHCARQEDWLKHKANILNSANIKTGKIRYVTRLSYGKMRDFVEIDSRKPTSTKILRDMFYPNGVKVYPNNLIVDFNFEMLSIIYQDDGRQNKISHTNNLIKGVRTRVETIPFVNMYEFSLESFDEYSIQNFQICLLNLGIESRISKRNRVIVSRAKSKKIMYEGMKPFIINCMKYKIDAIPSLSYKQ